MNQYRRGARVERLLRKKLEADGLYVVRSAGSKGAADLVAWDKNHCYVIQVSLVGVKTKADYNKLRTVPLMPHMTRQMYEYDRGKWKITRV